MDIFAFFAFFTDNEKKLKNLSKIACVWKIQCIFVTLLGTGWKVVKRIRSSDWHKEKIHFIYLISNFFILLS